MLEFAKEALDQISLTIDAAVNGAMHYALAGRGDVGFGSAGSDQVEQRIGVIAAIGDDVPAFEASEQKGRRTQIVVLSGGQHKPHR